MTDLNTGIPSTRWLQAMVQKKSAISILLSTGDRLSGQLKWIDPDCICLLQSSGGEQLIWRQAIAMVELHS